MSSLRFPFRRAKRKKRTSVLRQQMLSSVMSSRHRMSISFSRISTRLRRFARNCAIFVSKMSSMEWDEGLGEGEEGDVTSDSGVEE
jgi:hypothetical protein